MGLAEPRLGTAGLGQIVFVFLVEGPKLWLGGGRHGVREAFHHNWCHLHGGLLLEPAKVVPLPSGGVATERRLVQHQHGPSGQFCPEGLEEVLLREGKWAQPQPCQDFVKLFLPHKIACELTQKIIDCPIAHNHAVGLRILGQKCRLNALLLPIRQERQPRRIPAAGRHRLRQKPVDERPRGDHPFQPTLPECAAVPGHGNWILGFPGIAHLLQNRGQHKKREHRPNGHKYEQGTLVFTKELERADHGTACELASNGKTAGA